MKSECRNSKIRGAATRREEIRTSKGQCQDSQSFVQHGCLDCLSKEPPLKSAYVSTSSGARLSNLSIPKTIFNHRANLRSSHARGCRGWDQRGANQPRQKGFCRRERG